MSKIQHLTLFLIKKSIQNFQDAVKDAGATSMPTAQGNLSFDGALYLPTPSENAPAWLPFVQTGFPNTLVPTNRMASALLFLRASNRIFAFTFGHARHLLDPDSYERDFGLRVVVNRVSKDKIRGVSLRVFKETSVKRQEEAAKGTDLRTFGVDIQQDLLRGVTGTPDDTSLALRLSGTDSLSIDVAIDFKDLAEKCKALLIAYKGTDYQQRGFDWIDNLKVVRSPSIIDQLDAKLLSGLKAKNHDIQMLCPDGINRMLIRGFLYKEEKANAEKRSELETDEWKNAVATDLQNFTVDDLRERRIRAFDDTGALVAEIPDRDCFVFETQLKGTKHVLSNGEWFEVASNFNTEISNYLKRISTQPISLPDFDKSWKDGEDQYVSEAAKSSDLMSMHTKTCTIAGSQIEPCDLLHKTGALVHVKMWSQSATFSHLLAQGAVSAETLLRYPEFRDHVSTSATKHQSEIKKLFPKDGFVTSNLDVVLALVRETSRPLPFFSRLNLMREGQRIERLGYKLSYYRIAKK
jgi:uncharacterized protein (TIGR04141 family)